MKRCPRCEAEKDISEFYTHKGGRPHSYCKDCDKELKRDYEKKNRERISASKKARFALYPWENNRKYVRRTSRKPFWETRLKKDLHAAKQFFANHGVAYKDVPKEELDAYLKIIAIRRLIKIRKEANHGTAKKRG